MKNILLNPPPPTRLTLFNNKFEQPIEWVCLLCGVILILVWPLTGTIAVRNIALVLGCLTSLGWLYCRGSRINFQMALPSFYLLLVPLWLWAHYIFLPTEVSEQIYDLKGTWLRVLLAVFMATVLGYMIGRRPNYIKWIWGSMALLALITFIWFLWQVWSHDRWFIIDFRAFFKYKSAVVYFLMWPCLVGYALLTLYICYSKENTRLYWVIVTSIFFLVIVCWLDFMAAHALNGVLISAFMGFIFLCWVFLKSTVIPRRGCKNKLILTFILGVVFATTFSVFWQYDQKYERKLANLMTDAQIGFQIDKYDDWRLDPKLWRPKLPTDDSGREVNQSTYMRAAWFVKGLKILISHPEGAGFSHLAFRHFMRQENPQVLITKTHSGWMDYALGTGVPGLFFTWLSMYLVFTRAIKILGEDRGFQSLSITLPAIWLLLGVWLMWWVVEVSEREFIEQLFFMVALLSGATARGKLSASELRKILP